MSGDDRKTREKALSRYQNLKYNVICKIEDVKHTPIEMRSIDYYQYLILITRIFLTEIAESGKVLAHSL